MPLPSGVQNEVVRLLALAAMTAVVSVGVAQSPRQPLRPSAAYFIRSLEPPSDRKEQRSDILDTPMLPGSVVKTITLVAALESQTIEPETMRVCRRVVTTGGRKYTCSHPDLKRPLTAAEALAHSCNDFFVALAPRLPRSALNDVRLRLGLPPVAAAANFADALIGLDGPRMTPRVMLDVVTRLVGVDRGIALREETRRVLLEGLRGAASYGSASVFASEKISALAKTGTAPMPGGSNAGIVVALTPAERPRRALVVIAPGAAGLDAAALAVDLLAGRHLTAATEPQIPRATSAASDLVVRVGVTKRNGDIQIQRLPLEEYVARVVAGEGQPRAAEGAQQALAIAVRTFALANRNRHRREGYDLCDTTHCQVMRAATPTTQIAAQATSGRVLMYQGQPAMVFYSAWCGGQSELASQVWPGALDYAFEPSQPDAACRHEPGWTSEIVADDIERALRAAGLRGDRLRELRVLQRNASGRVSRLRADGFSPSELTGHDFRIAVGRVAGWQLLKSTAFEVRRTSRGYSFTGRGFGHGVGLCVVGAGHRAAQGATADQILAFYYPGLRIEQVSGQPTLTTAPAAAAPIPKESRDILLALPAGEESERKTVLGIVRKIRDEVVANTGVKPPGSLRITVHPTVESFGRATGQPWWVSGATDGASIEMLPIAVLRRQGQLDRTLRHEVAHALLDGALAKRPLWVREGAASYFADPAPAAPPPDNLKCPSDDEFLRPLSAGAHRDAYVRAAVCFRREIEKGKRWSDVR